MALASEEASSLSDPVIVGAVCFVSFGFILVTICQEFCLEFPPVPVNKHIRTCFPELFCTHPSIWAKLTWLFLTACFAACFLIIVIFSI